MAEAIRTTCPYCGVGCGVFVTPEDDGSYTVKGDPEHPANFGRLCSKGSALGETLSDDERLLHPVMDGKPTNWDAALDRVSSEFKYAIDTYGPDSVAFYVSGQLMTEAYYVANKLMKGYIGSANIDTNSRLCMASSVVGHKRAFGSDTVPGNYEDLEQADMVVLVGSNLAWCHPVLYQRLAAAQKDHGTHIVVIDPRKTATCDIADQHLALTPGTDVRLFNGLLSHLAAVGAEDQAFVEQYTEGLEGAIIAARSDVSDASAVAKACGLNASDLMTFYANFAKTEKVVTIYSQGVNQSSQGTDKVNAILNCHLMTGRIGKPGSGPFSVTGQPNAMGGREVGGLANTLAAHMDFNEESKDRVQRFWKSPRIACSPGLKAVDLFKEIEAGKIKALWIMATNPAVSLPNANQVQRALELCQFVAVSDCVPNNDTIRYADVVLPTTTWGERDGTVTNSERRISRQRPFRKVPGDAREDWDIICDVADRMGFGYGFRYSNSADIFAEHAKLSGFENQGQRDFDISGFLDVPYDDILPTQWPVRKGEMSGQERLFADGGFFTPDAKAKIVAVKAKSPHNQQTETYPLVLNTGRMRDHWHTMTRTGLSARLSSHRAEPTVEINSSDAQTYGLKSGDLATVSSAFGTSILRVDIVDGQNPGSVFVPIHWSDTNSANAVISRLVNPVTDPFSGQPESKFTPISISPFKAKWNALLVTREPGVSLDSAYWTKITGTNCTLCAMSGEDEISDWQIWAQEKIGGEAENWLSYSDPASGCHRFAMVQDGILQGALFVSRGTDLPSLDWVQAQFSVDELDALGRSSLLAGRAPGQTFDPGPMVCSCFSVGVNHLRQAISDGVGLSVEAIGEALKAGTNCGSCKPEIQAVLDQESSQTNTDNYRQEVA